MSFKSPFGFETQQLHAGSQPEPVTGARQTPIFQNASYVFSSAEEAASLYNLQSFGFIYSRLTNPTVSALEERLAVLEGGRGATCCSSGHAAQLLALFPLMEPGREIVASPKLYGGSITQIGKTFQKFGWRGTFVDMDDLDATRAAITEDTRALFCESLANPGGVVSDLEGLARIAEEHDIPLVVDNTMATPYLVRPFEWGANLIVHSTTKFLSGNGTSVGGAVIDDGKFNWGNGKFPSLSEPEEAYHGIRFWESFGDLAYTLYTHAISLRDLGTTAAPMNAWLTMLGLETLSLRIERHCANAQKVAEFLDNHPAVSWVSYAGLPSSNYKTLAEKYLPKGAGSVFTFAVKGGYDMASRVVEGVNLISHLANVGDSRSLILHPASTTHRQLTKEQLMVSVGGDDVIRISVGLETAEDIIADLDQALNNAEAKAAE